MSNHDPQLIEAAALNSPHLLTLRAAFLICAHHGVMLSPQDLSASEEEDSAALLLKLLGARGLQTRLLSRAGWHKASRLGNAYPVLVELTDGHWAVLVHAARQQKQRTAAWLNPVREAEGVRFTPWEEFAARWTVRLILVGRTTVARKSDNPFGLTWFYPALYRERRLLAGVAISVIIGNLIAFTLPLLLQTLIDRVIAHHAWNTLLSITGIFVFLVIVDAMFSYVRQRLIQVAGGRVDAEVGSRSVEHLLSLPMSVFEATPAGVLARNIQQTDRIRQFLTGRLMQTLLDAALLPVLLTILALLSGTLTLIIAGYGLAIAGCMAITLPIMQQRLNAVYGIESERQALLIETLHNMRAVKSLAVEESRLARWDNSLASSVRRQWDVGRIAALAGTFTGLLERLMQVTVVSVGVALVLGGSITTGTLVAVLMLAGRVSGPFLQMVALANEWQEAALSIKVLKQIMDQPSEQQPDMLGSAPLLLGGIRLSEVQFTYPGAAVPALDRVSFSVDPGEIIGIVGRSGSGKTTLTRLLQGIETPQAGLLLFDGTDIRNMRLADLRRQLGVVLQDNLMFRGTIRENVALARPDARLEAIIRATQLAGADEFIGRLPQGLDTMLEEGGANLSGGQRQRIAIARALMVDPKILILDEATSALDPESEALVNRNLNAIAQGRTMIVVSHRLSSLVRADRILVLDKGRVVDFAPHQLLVERCDLYRQLWLQQTEHLQ